jgi:hypothetical protein
MSDKRKTFLEIKGNRIISRHNFILICGSCLCTVLAIFAAVGIFYLFFRWRTVDPRICFVVDMLEQRVPDWEMPLHRQPGSHLHREAPPLAFGKLCFDHQQLMVDWRIQQSYWRLYTLRDLMIRGPLNDTSDFAPAVLTLGVQIAAGKELRGSTIIGRHLLDEILEHHRRYYISLEGDFAEFDKSSDGKRRREIGRDILIHHN